MWQEKIKCEVNENENTTYKIIWAIAKATAPGKMFLAVNAYIAAAAAAKSLQLCLTLCDPIGSSPSGSTIPGILQARTLGWVAISFSNAWKWKVKVKSLSRVRLERPHGLQPTRLLHPWDFPGKSTGVGCHCLLRNAYVRHKQILQVNNLSSQLKNLEKKELNKMEISRRKY